MKKEIPEKIKFIKSIGEYVLIQKIGDGTSAKVYLGYDKKTNKLVAVKAINKEALQDERGKTNLKRELEILNKMHHENIIQIIKFKQTKQNNYIILEYCNGGTLYDYKESVRKETGKGLNEFFIQKILKQLTKGLEYMHSQKIIHRDIKLENILLNYTNIANEIKDEKLPPKINYKETSLNNSFTIKIADLGYSKDLTNDTAKTTLGTPLYISPDVLNGKSYNSSIDLWSLGVMTYELLTGFSPFKGDTTQEVFKNISKGVYDLPKNLRPSIEIISFINGLLQYYPEKRLDWEQIKAHPFLNKNPLEFNYIDIEAITDKNQNSIELDSKNCDNLLWVFFKCKNFNMKIDKINEKEVKKPEIKKDIDKNKVINEEVEKALKEEKLALAKEREDVKRKKKEAEENKKKAMEETKKLQDEKNKIIEKEKIVINEKDKLLKEKEQKGDLNTIKDNENELKDIEAKLKEIQKEKNDTQKKLKTLEKKLNETQEIIKNSEKELDKLNLEPKGNDNDIIAKKAELDKIKEGNIKKAKDIENLKNEQILKEKEHKKENFNLTKNLVEASLEKKNIEGKFNEVNDLNDKIQKKDNELKNLESKIQQISEEKEKEINNLKEENKKRKKNIEELNNKIKEKENENDEKKGIFQSFIEFDKKQVDKEITKEYGWEEIDEFDDSKSIDFDIEPEIIDEYEINEKYVDEETDRNELNKN